MKRKLQIRLVALILMLVAAGSAGDIVARGVFQSLPGEDRPTTYLVNRTIVPNLTQTSVSVRLNAPGSQYYDRINQLDLVIGKEIRAGRMRFQPKMELYNILNVNPVLTENTTFGSALGRPLTVLPARFVRVNLQVNF